MSQYLQSLPKFPVQSPTLAAEGVWAHATPVPEPGGLLLATRLTPSVLGSMEYWQASPRKGGSLALLGPCCPAELCGIQTIALIVPDSAWCLLPASPAGELHQMVADTAVPCMVPAAEEC